MNRHIPQRPLRDATHSQWQWQRDRVNRRRVPQGAVPDVAYTDPGDGKERIVELRFIKQCPSRYGRQVATSLRAAVNKREQQLYQEYLTRLRLKDTELLQTPDGQVGPLERGFTSATSPEDLKGWVVGF
jgi:hypothetical protein